MALVDGRDFIADMLTDTPVEARPAAKGATLRFDIKKFILHAMLEKANSVIPSKDSMPVLKCFQITARPDRLRIIASDLELSVVATTDMVSVTDPGTAVFPATKLLHMVRESGDGIVTIRVRNGAAAITIGRTTWNLKLPGGADYPPMPEIADVRFAPVDRVAFLTGLHAVRYAACKQPTRQSLMMVDVKGGKLTACDGARIQQATVTDCPGEFQLPIGAVDDLIKLLRTTEVPDLHVGESDHHLIFRFGSDVMIVNKLVAQFPDMEARMLRPALENTHRLNVDRRELLDAIKRVRIAADPETSALALTLTAGHLTVSARDKYGNDATETLDADWTRAERTIVVNHAFLTEMINATAVPTCAFYLGVDTKTRKAPLLLRDTDSDTTGVVQQMVLDWVA